MYWKFVFKRIIYGILMYSLMVLIYSTLFNAVADKTLRSQIDESVNQEMRFVRTTNGDEFSRIRAQKLAIKTKQYHLDEPLHQRIFWRTVRTLAFDFGNSTIIKSSGGDRQVSAIIMEALPRTIILFSLQVVLAVVLGVIMGLYAARRPNSPFDRFNTMITLVMNGMPVWWLGMIAIMLFAYNIPIFPSGGMHINPAPTGFAGFLDYLWHLALPLITLTFVSMWSIAYLSRNIFLSSLQEDYVMAARARGIPEARVLFGHTLRTSMPVIMTIAVLGLFSSIAGNIIVEGIFNWPGIGNLYFVAVQQSDVPVLMATLAFQTLINMAGFIILDVIYGFLDPRIKVGMRA